MHTQPMFKDNALRDKIIIITGGGTGLGKSMARYFLQSGANVVIASRKKEVLESAAEELRAGIVNPDHPITDTNQPDTNYGQILPVVCDVRDYAQVENCLKQTVEKFGSFNTLVNNAAGNFISPTERLSHRAFDAVVDIVLKGSYYFTLAAGKYWIEKKIKGNILNILTTYSFTGSAYVVPSACGKAGVLALTRSLAVEWAKYGIRINAVAPGAFPTEGAWSRLFPEPLRKKMDPSEKIPIGRVGEHQELANLAAYLISDFAAYITGEIICIDGGEWLKGAGQFNNLEMVTPEMWDMLERMVRGTKK
ncbi:MAG: SDR family oxidoreductase [Bacteroidetes bacterium]|nr:SDR family oxidoreductase [Bacteroidota bacterium]